MTLLLSVIIPTRNRASRLAPLLKSLATQNAVSFEWEVIVVDNGSTDDTEAVTRSAASRTAIPIRYTVEGAPGLHNGRHRGAIESAAQVLGYLDDDMILTPSWVQPAELIGSAAYDAVVGRILPYWESEPPRWLRALIPDGVNSFLGLLDLGERGRDVDPELVFGGNCFIRRDLVFDLGGFHPDSVPPDRLAFRGDGECGLMEKFRDAGKRAWYDPRATAYHVISADRMTIEYMCARAFREGISQSYAEMRRNYFTRGTPVPIGRVERWLSKSPREAVTAIRRRAVRAARRLAPDPLRPLQEQLQAAFRSGKEFHRRAVASDPKLLSYVLRDTYLSAEETASSSAGQHGGV